MYNMHTHYPVEQSDFEGSLSGKGQPLSLLFLCFQVIGTSFLSPVSHVMYIFISFSMILDNYSKKSQSKNVTVGEAIFTEKTYIKEYVL